MAIAKTKPVVDPTTAVETSAHGTVVAGLVHSSARCIVASMPANMVADVTKPTRKATPSDQPDVFLKSVHTYVDGCLDDRARHVTLTAKKVASVR
jgi:hypothetical protein